MSYTPKPGSLPDKLITYLQQNGGHARASDMELLFDVPSKIVQPTLVAACKRGVLIRVRLADGKRAMAWCLPGGEPEGSERVDGDPDPAVLEQARGEKPAKRAKHWKAPAWPVTAPARVASPVVQQQVAPARRANDLQHGGTHYQALPIQPWDYIAGNDIGFLEGNAIKYLTRWREKGGIEDIRKAGHYVQKLLEVETARAAE